MAYTRQIINVGTVADDGSGDYLRDALVKVNSNFENSDRQWFINLVLNSFVRRLFREMVTEIDDSGCCDIMTNDEQ